jgi:hypothetical protein
MTTLKATQVALASGDDLETALASKVSATTLTETLSGITEFKTGTIPSTATISANSTITVTVTFSEEFPNSCLYFNAVLTPAISTDFYGLVSIVSMTKTAVQFVVKNGATAQAVSSGKYFAVGN